MEAIKETVQRTRADIWSDIERKKAEIKALRAQIRECAIEDLLLSDDAQWYTEAEEDFFVSRRPKIVEKRLVGRVRWNETFRDESTGNTIEIERSKVVRINGVWQADLSF